MLDVRSPHGRLTIALITVICLLAVALGGAVIQVFQPAPTGPWGVYTSPAVLGERADESRIITRGVDPDGFPIFDPSAEDNPHFTTVRCGPPGLTDLVSVRDWFILGQQGAIDTPLGASAFSFELDEPDTDSGCVIQPFTTVAVPPEVVNEAEGRPIRFRLTISAEGYTPAVVSSEWFVVSGEDPFDLTSLDIAVPRVSPIR